MYAPTIGTSKPRSYKMVKIELENGQNQIWSEHAVTEVAFDICHSLGDSKNIRMLQYYIIYSFNLVGMDEWNFTIVIKVVKKDEQYHSYKKVMFLFCTSCLVNKHNDVKRFWFLYKKDSRHIWNCQLLDFSRLLFQDCKHQPPCNVEIKTIRSFGWIS